MLNYGHSFGHAIEAATNFKVPHGIAVTMGMDIANFIAAKIGFGTNEPFLLSHDTMRKNYRSFQSEPVDIKLFRSSLEKDKKNMGAARLTKAVGNIQNACQRQRLGA